MRRALHYPSRQEYLAESVSAALSGAPRGDWRCPNPACGQPCTHVPATLARRAYFKHAPGVADMESCYYFAEETPTQRFHDCVDLVEAELIERYGAEQIQPEAWVDGISYPLDLLVARPGGQRWGLWYVTPRRAAMTLNLLKQAAAAGLPVAIFTHVAARKPPELFEAREQQAFLLDPGTGTLSQTIDHKPVSAPLAHWQFDDGGRLIPPALPAAPPPPAVVVPRPAAPGGTAQASFFTDATDAGAEPEALAAPAPAVQAAALGDAARGNIVWALVDPGRLPAELTWMIQAPAADWGPQVLQWFLSRPGPFRISHVTQFVALRWRLHPSLSGPHDLAFLRAMHGFWELLEQMGYAKITDHPHPVHVTPVRGK